MATPVSQVFGKGIGCCRPACCAAAGEAQVFDVQTIRSPEAEVPTSPGDSVAQAASTTAACQARVARPVSFEEEETENAEDRYASSASSGDRYASSASSRDEYEPRNTATTQKSMESLGSTSSQRRKRLSQSSDGMDHDVLNIVSFGEQQSLLRATRLTTVMSRGAAIFEESRGSAETYALSEQVSVIDAFLSHNWAVSRKRKFFCLVLHCNFGKAALSSAIALAACIMLTTLGVRLLVVEAPLFFLKPELGEMRSGTVCTVLITPVVFLTLFFAHELERLAGLRGRTVFLDKTCINQVEPALQAEGIRKLGAFLRKSSTMLVLYSDLYLRKVWTVYEVACFLSVHRASDLIVVPVHQPLIILGGLATMYVTEIARLTCTLLGGPALLMDSITGIAVVVAAVLLRHWARDKEAIRQRVSGFEVSECICAVEEDRPVVYENIAVMMRATGVVGEDASVQAALEGFNCIVRERLFRSFAASIGSVGLRYKHVVFLMLPYFANVADSRMMGEFLAGEEWALRYRICNVAMQCILIFGAFPLSIACLSRLCGCCLHYRGCREGLLIIAAVVLTWFVYNLQLRIALHVAFAAIAGSSQRDIFTAALALLLVAEVGLAVAVYGECWRRSEDDCDEE